MESVQQREQTCTQSSEKHTTWCGAVEMEDSHGREIITRQLNERDKVSASPFQDLQSLFVRVAVVTYRCPSATFSTVQSSFGNAPRGLTAAGSLPSAHCFPLHKKAFSLAQHSPMLCSSAHLPSHRTNNQADRHEALLVI